MLLRTYKWGLNCQFKQLARNFGILKHQPALGFEHHVAKLPIIQHVRCKSNTPMNTIILFVPQQEAWVVERMGKFHRILNPGLNILTPIIDRIKYVQCLKEIAIEIPQQSAVTSDNVTLNIDGVLYLRVVNPFLASYGVDDPEFAVVQIAQTTMRSELGKIPLDNVFREREGLNVCIVESINKASEAWGIACLRYEIRDIRLPPRVQEAMQMQVEAERKKRAAVLESEGTREAEINIAEGKRLAQILASEAIKQEEINKATGTAQALVAIAEARAKSLKLVANALNITDAKNAAAYSIAEQYVKAFNKLAKVNNTLILPSNVSDVSSLVTQAMTIYKQVMSQPTLDNPDAKENKDALSVDDSDESFEYFSDKEEAEKHRSSKRKQNPKFYPYRDGEK
ncbi:stomatin-like protein 2, mitochondrial [Bombus pascuorum]|uniref:stomatin-like protein 2, mitochondrial n=1 Tax=Bombus pascuorum TaxID=65598 RepID=UPI00213CD6DC|nr:stomatin-like protein 2, mitochondrial [Bombus pascuorum]XP_060830340.1 stomatin-like protein 2, mitochondrial [Bombus pascuorum]